MIESGGGMEILIVVLFAALAVGLLGWLPVTPRITVLGRLEGAGSTRRVVKDPTIGLLLSPHSPRRAATQELLKGLLGLVVLAIGLVGALKIWEHVIRG
jgi:hypothetical protein